MIRTRSTRLTQPAGAAAVAEKWALKSPVLLASAATGFANAVTGSLPALGSTSRFLLSSIGVGANGSASSTTSTIGFEDYAFGGTTPVTVIAFSDEMAGANRTYLAQGAEVILRVTAAGTGVEFILNSFATNDRTSVVADARSSPGFFAGGTYGPSGKLRAYANTAVAEITPTGTYANSAELFTAIYTQGLNQLFDKRLALLAVFRSEFSQAEMRELSANPWQLFKPVDRRIWVPGSVGGVGPVDGSASMPTAPASLSAAGSVSISGAASLTTASATMAAAGSLPGGAEAAMATAPAILAASGALAIQGTAAMSTLAAMLAATGALPIVASGAMATGAAVMSADGALGSDATASASMTTAPATLASTGALPISASATQTTSAASMAATGDLAGQADGSASMSTAPATVAAQGLLQLLAAAGMQTSTPILVAFGSEPSTGPVIDWAAPGARALVPQASVRAIIPDPDVRAIVEQEGDDMKIIKTFEMYKPDRPIYEIDFDAKYLAPLGDTATTLVGFQSDAGLTVTPQVAVGGALSSGVIKFSAEAPTAAGPIRVAAQILTAAGRKKSGMVEITIEPEIVFTT